MKKKWKITVLVLSPVLLFLAGIVFVLLFLRPISQFSWEQSVLTHYKIGMDYSELEPLIFVNEISMWGNMQQGPGEVDGTDIEIENDEYAITLLDDLVFVYLIFDKNNKLIEKHAECCL